MCYFNAPSLCLVAAVNNKNKSSECVVAAYRDVIICKIICIRIEGWKWAWFMQEDALNHANIFSKYYSLTLQLLCLQSIKLIK